MENKWITIWGASASMLERRLENYAKNVTLRFSFLPTVDGEKLKIRLSNRYGSEDVTLTHAYVALEESDCRAVSGTHKALSFGGEKSVTMKKGGYAVSDELDLDVRKGQKILVSLYFADLVCLDTGVTNWGPLFKADFALGDHAADDSFPIEEKRGLGAYYFIDDVEVLADRDSRAIIAFGDSITAQSWPEQLALKMLESGRKCTVVRRAISGSRILRRYNCIEYNHYGVSGIERIEYELDVAGADTMVVLHGVNDLIHPDGVNSFRPMSHLPVPEDMIEGFRKYIKIAHAKGIRIFLCTILPIEGWRTYEEGRNEIRVAVNEWIRTQKEADGIIDLDAEMRREDNVNALRAEYDCGDHLHPSYEGAGKIAELVYDKVM